MNDRLEKITASIKSERDHLLKHPVYAHINNLDTLQHFSEIHVFAVWDFMSLLKSLQINLTSVSIPWVPVGDADTRYLINEIVLGEESDVDEFGNRISHFELYLQAMKQMGAQTGGIEHLLDLIKSGVAIQEAIEQTNLPEKVKVFLRYTFEIVLNAPLHVKAAVFTFGREDLIPNMFMQILNQLYTDAPDKVSIFKYYIERHIEVDGGHHSHLALQMVANLCGEDDQKWKEALEASQQSLQKRSQLWDAIVEAQ